MSFGQENSHGHTFASDAFFAQTKRRTWRPGHHERSFGRANTRPSWYRGEKAGMISLAPSAMEAQRYETKAGGYQQRHWLEDSQGESRMTLAHSGNIFRGESSRDPRANDAANFRASILQREANKSVHDGNKVLALVRRENQNSTVQPLYPTSIINNAFEKHNIAKTIDFKGRPRPEHNNPFGTRRTQKCFLPYVRTRSDFPRSSSGDNKSAPYWWPKTPLAPNFNDHVLAAAREMGGGLRVAKEPSTSSRVIGHQQYQQPPLPRTPPGYLVSARTGNPISVPTYVN